MREPKCQNKISNLPFALAEIAKKISDGEEQEEELVGDEPEPLRGVDAGAGALDVEQDGVGEEGVREHDEGKREDEVGGEEHEGAQRPCNTPVLLSANYELRCAN